MRFRNATVDQVELRLKNSAGIGFFRTKIVSAGVAFFSEFKRVEVFWESHAVVEVEAKTTFSRDSFSGAVDTGEEPTELTDGDGTVLGIEDRLFINRTDQTLRFEVEAEPDRSGDFIPGEERRAKVAEFEIRRGDGNVLTVFVRPEVP